MLELHPAVENDKELILAKSNKTPLSSLDSNKKYSLYKIYSKKIPSNKTNELILSGKIYLIGTLKNNQVQIWLYFSGKGPIYDWFKTSPILKVKKAGPHIEVETENSFYLIKEE